MSIGKIEKFIIHHVGNKNDEDGVHLSSVLTKFDSIEQHIESLIVNSFKSEEMYKFYFEPNIELNPMYQFINDIFKDEESFIEQSKNAANYLYEKSMHPQVKAGELCVVHFSNCLINGETVDCIGLFKVESKDIVLKVSGMENGYSVNEEEGINTKKLESHNYATLLDFGMKRNFYYLKRQ